MPSRRGSGPTKSVCGAGRAMVNVRLDTKTCNFAAFAWNSALRAVEITGSGQSGGAFLTLLDTLVNTEDPGLSHPSTVGDLACTQRNYVNLYFQKMF